MVDMSEIYKNKKKALVRGSGDLATGVGIALYRANTWKKAEYRVQWNGEQLLKKEIG